MNTKILLPTAGAWLTTIAAAYYIGSSDSSENSAADTSASSAKSSQSGQYSQLSGNRYSSGSTNSARLSARSSASNSGATSAPSGSIRSISELGDPIERSRQLLSYIDTLSASEFESVVDEFRNMGMTRERMGEYSMLLHAWGKADPTGAIAYLKENTRSDFAVKEVLASWASTNANAAIAWANENHTGDKANPYLVGIIRGLADTNPTLATQVLQQLPFSEERGEALRGLTPRIAALGVTGAQQWLSGIEDPKLVNGASAYLADHFSKQDPEMGAQWVSTITDEEARQRALLEVVDNWADKDPSAAQVWIETLPYDDQMKAGPEFVSSYASKDPHAAADWLDARSNSENYQTLLREFAEGATRKDPVLALNYGNELNDESSRSRTVGRALWTLYRQDKNEARNWINNNELPERVQRYVGRMMEDQ
ncbi:hypothetical protein ACFSW8_11170 [Rubritalea tangerina]|uniref:HEAT repeat domain-containing protein n=2 Tax=Rubritalea tangerina TaxID=430798 RepID=A0ABW4ZBS6_9BACT